MSIPHHARRVTPAPEGRTPLWTCIMDEVFNLHRAGPKTDVGEPASGGGAACAGWMILMTGGVYGLCESSSFFRDEPFDLYILEHTQISFDGDSARDTVVALCHLLRDQGKQAA